MRIQRSDGLPGRRGAISPAVASGLLAGLVCFLSIGAWLAFRGSATRAVEREPLSPSQRAAFGWALIDAVAVEDVGAVEELLKLGADPVVRHPYGQTTALSWAIECRNPRLVTLLLNHGVDVNARDEEGGTALHDASSWGNVALVEELAERGANPDSRSDRGGTPLMAAASSGHVRLAEFLIARGAAVNARMVDGETALMLAAADGQPGTTRVLLAHGAAVDATGSHGETALMLAAGRSGPGGLAVVEALLAHGANPALKNREGWTARHIAIATGHRAIAARLKKANR